LSNALEISLARNGAQIGVHIAPPDPLPLDRLVLGRPAEEVAALMPRLFNLCGVAQGLAARMSLGLSAAGADPRREILRDHLAKLCLHWPRLTGLAPQALPEGWAEGGAPLQDWLWGGPRPARLAHWLAEGRGTAPLIGVIAGAFGPGEAVAAVPPLSDPMLLTAQENSPAGRGAEDPLMQQAEAAFGRGPLWRALGRVLDLDRLAAAPVAAELRADGTALVAAARGTYALRARAEAGRVVALERVTPTDHLLAPGGALEQALARLPASQLARAALVVDILDPCVPVALQEGKHA